MTNSFFSKVIFNGSDRFAIVMKMIKYLILFFTSISIAQQHQVEFSVYFDTDSDFLSTTSQSLLDSKLLLEEDLNIDSLNILLKGFCDDRGSESYNKKLAHRRIWSIINYLNPHYNYSAFSEIAVGELPLSNPINIKEQRAQNRRVDVILTYDLIPEIKEEKEPIINESIEKYRSYDILKDSLKIGDKLVFNNLIFYPGRHVLRESSYPVMDSIINSLLLHKKYKIEIQGHICCLASGVYGRDMDTGQWNLSQARAEQIKRFMVKYGVDADRLTTVGKQANFKTGKGDYYDRRVEIHITGIREEDLENQKQN